MSYPPPYAPHQPQPPQKKRKWPWIVSGIVLAFIVFGACAGQASPPVSVSSSASGTTTPLTSAETGTAPTPAAAPTVVKVKQLGDAFEANQIAAEQRWGGQFVQFTAPVGNINSSGITFTDVTSKYSFTQISCGVQDEAAVVKLAKGKPVTVRGIVGGDQLLGVISLEECQIVS